MCAYRAAVTTAEVQGSGARLVATPRAGGSYLAFTSLARTIVYSERVTVGRIMPAGTVYSAWARLRLQVVTVDRKAERAFLTLLAGCRTFTPLAEWTIECRLAKRFGGWGRRSPLPPSQQGQAVKPSKRRRGGTEHTDNRG